MCNLRLDKPRRRVGNDYEFGDGGVLFEFCVDDYFHVKKWDGEDGYSNGGSSECYTATASTDDDNDNNDGK